MPASRRQFVRRTTTVAVVATAGCGGRTDAGRESTSDRGEAADTPPDGSPSSAPTERTTSPPRSSLVLHDVDRDDLPRRSRIGVVSPPVWEWLTAAAETGAVDVATEDGWSPPFPDDETPTPTPTERAERAKAPNVDLAVAMADVVVLDGEPYAVRTTYRAGEASYRLKTRPVSANDVEPPDETDTTAVVSELPSDRRRIALAAIEDEDGYVVGFHEERSEAFDAVAEHDYLRHDGETFWTFVVHGDKFRPHTTLWATPIDAVDDGDDVVFEVERVDLSERGQATVAAAVPDGAEPVESVPETLAEAVETYDYLATTTGLYRARIDG
jgi:hypothetical protein